MHPLTVGALPKLVVDKAGLFNGCVVCLCSSKCYCEQFVLEEDTVAVNTNQPFAWQLFSLELSTSYSLASLNHHFLLFCFPPINVSANAASNYCNKPIAITSLSLLWQVWLHLHTNLWLHWRMSVHFGHVYLELSVHLATMNELSWNLELFP